MLVTNSQCVLCLYPSKSFLSVQLPGVGKAELGATWLHGLDGNPIYETALRHGLMHGHERKVASTQPHLPSYALPDIP